jgi:hypothetical protein
MLNMVCIAPLKIAPFPEKSSVVEGERLTLVCALTSGEQPLQINWYRFSQLHQKNHYNRPEILTTTTTEQDGSRQLLFGSSLEPPLFSVLNPDPFTSLLSIQSVTERHVGLYVCNASSPQETTKASQYLTVLGMKSNDKLRHLITMDFF